jgi:malate synthase
MAVAKSKKAAKRKKAAASKSSTKTTARTTTKTKSAKSASKKARAAGKAAVARRQGTRRKVANRAAPKSREAKANAKSRAAKARAGKRPAKARNISKAQARRGSATARSPMEPAAKAAAAPTALRKPTAKPPTTKRPAAKRPVTKRAFIAASLVPGIVVNGTLGPRYAEILTAPALGFLARLHRMFNDTRLTLLAARRIKQRQFDGGRLPDFLADTAAVRAGDWRVAPIPADLMDRRVEITGPVDRRMVVNALNSGANVYMADFEDANSPTWANNIEGQLNLKDRWQDRIDFTDKARGKSYAVDANPAVLVVRPRGWHLPEAHLTVDGQPISGALFDFGLYFFHNAAAQMAKGTYPYFYLPKLESHREARLWNQVFEFAQRELDIPVGTIKATVLIETLPAAFEMDEILYELRDHVAGLNAGRWDYIFSFIKCFAKSPNYVLPDRSQVVMGEAFLGAYAALLVKTCHRRGAFAMGGMAAQIPVKNDPAANEAAFAKVRADKEREVREGYDGTWVAHPDLVPVAKDVFDRLMPQPNQLERQDADLTVSRDQLLQIHQGTKTEAGFRENIRVGVQYIEAWLGGRGAVPIYNLMEDAATAEISRAQTWQWLKYGAVLENGVKVTRGLFERALKEEMVRVQQEVGAKRFADGHFPAAIKLFRKLALADEFLEFLTVPAYELIA